jgi:hypothetical protein
MGVPVYATEAVRVRTVLRAGCAAAQDDIGSEFGIAAEMLNAKNQRPYDTQPPVRSENYSIYFTLL